MEHSTALARPTRDWLTKVPAITATFWVIKVLSTTIGETFADYLAVNVGLGPAVTDALMIAVLAVALVIQFRTRKYTRGSTGSAWFWSASWVRRSPTSSPTPSASVST